MRILCIGNMNNNFFALARYLRDRGYAADLAILPYEPEHFGPEMDCYGGCPDWARRVVWGNWWGPPSVYGTLSPEELAREFQPYDFLIGCGSAPAFVHKAGRVLDVFMPYGSDFYQLPFFEADGELLPVSRDMQTGLARARHFFYAEGNAMREQLWHRLGLSGQRHFHSVPLLHAPTYAPEVLADRIATDPACARFADIRAQHDFVVFHHSRHVWLDQSRPEALKGNDVLLHGFKQFVRSGAAANPALVLFEYGPDHTASRELAAKLGLGPHVHWFELMPRKDIMPGLAMADVVAAEFHYSWMGGGVAYETLTLGKPLLAHRDDALYEKHFPELYPMLHAVNAEDIAERLAWCASEREAARALGEDGRRWFQRHVVDAPLETLERLIAEAAGPGGKA